MKPVFVVDPSKCIGCMACVAACSIENAIPFTLSKSDPVGWPHTLWTRTWVKWIENEDPAPSRTFMPYLCLHCQDTPCERVCPTGATFKTPEGVILVDHSKCIGCGYCIVACPYGSRYKVKEGAFEKAIHDAMLHDVSKKLRGAGLEDYIMKPPSENKWAVAERAVDKCTLCYHRKEAGAWIPACVEVCPTKARMFGDLDDPHDPAAELVRTGKARHLRPDLGTGGLVYYVIP
jgi:Fe-S-cluster-containing dehydrogenase component